MRPFPRPSPRGLHPRAAWARPRAPCQPAGRASPPPARLERDITAWRRGSVISLPGGPPEPRHIYGQTRWHYVHACRRTQRCGAPDIRSQVCQVRACGLRGGCRAGGARGGRAPGSRAWAAVPQTPDCSSSRSRSPAPGEGESGPRAARPACMHERARSSPAALSAPAGLSLQRHSQLLQVSHTPAALSAPPPAAAARHVRATRCPCTSLTPWPAACKRAARRSVQALKEAGSGGRAGARASSGMWLAGGGRRMWRTANSPRQPVHLTLPKPPVPADCSSHKNRYNHVDTGGTRLCTPQQRTPARGARRCRAPWPARLRAAGQGGWPATSADAHSGRHAAAASQSACYRAGKPNVHVQAASTPALRRHSGTRCRGQRAHGAGVRACAGGARARTGVVRQVQPGGRGRPPVRLGGRRHQRQRRLPRLLLACAPRARARIRPTLTHPGAVRRARRKHGAGAARRRARRAHSATASQCAH